ncbi:MAG TPA: HAD hydrolase family protein [Verrucomicrobiae bacterium]|nr:HAD hydrolase family protein [Verrucomicrobiae bacterium]
MRERLLKIRLVLLDVDGVLTDGRIVYDANGVETKFFDVKDGHGIKLLQSAGIGVGIISARCSEVVKVRAAELGIEHLHQKIRNKLEPYRQVLAETGLSDEQVAFMGDDIQDLPLLTRVGFAAAPCDAVTDILGHVHFVTRNRGGRGAVREVCDLILKEQGLWERVTEAYYR